jgi:ketosteroid isomerase-like protein
MPADNARVADGIEVITRTFRLLDSDSYERALDFIDERFEMATPAELASEPDVYRGPEGVRRWWESFLDVMDYVRLEMEEVHPLDDDRALIEFVIRARGRSSGIETEQRAVGLATADGGKVVGLEFFTSLELARAAAAAPPR